MQLTNSIIACTIIMALTSSMAVAKTKAEKKRDRRIQTINAVFKDTKVRKGVYLVFLTGTTYEIIYHPSLLPKKKLMQKMKPVCAGHDFSTKSKMYKYDVSVKKDKNETHTITANDGKQRNAKRIWLECVATKFKKPKS